MFKFCRLHFLLLLGPILTVILGQKLTSIAATDISLPNNRPTYWLEIRQFRSQVTYQPVKNRSRSARIGDRLQKIGDRITTAKLAEATLVFDDGIGSVKVTEDTILQIKRMQTTPSGGRITLLSVPKGLARLQIRRFKNTSSRLQIQTPAGVAGVRGTEFGVGVDSTGKTLVATYSGMVTATAQGKTVNVNPGFFSVIIPGQPPTNPQPIEKEICLNVQTLTEVDTDKARLIAQVKPSSMVFVDGQSVPTSKEGKFEIQAPINSDRRVSVSVRNPGGEEKTYLLKVGLDPWRFYRQGNISQAEQIFRQQLQEDEKNADALLGLGYIAYRRNNLPLAQQRFEQALGANSNHVDAQIGLARIALRQSDPKPEELKRIEDLLLQQIKQQPDNLDYWILLGYVTQKQGNLLLAAERFQEVLNRSPNDLDGLIGLGLVKLNQQNKVEALALLEKAAKQTNDPGRLAEIQTYIDRAK
ncbi:FecR family protein [Merismopedia glauca]|uniref:Uncharacterized protein n=1 Tax=Merismopedia glauca CCAP 1448/3 TaxID=1296344 RepID=A0A2T1C3L5_9CYAN|nr:FecR family protein [Merismopedia glauca]PSB02737.1 hypothetical protein C7B64_11670 [Merismopedia glauca CCAP 1448/3]